MEELHTYVERNQQFMLLQIRTQVLNEEWEQTFRRWYPGFRPQTEEQRTEKAA